MFLKTFAYSIVLLIRSQFRPQLIFQSKTA